MITNRINALIGIGGIILSIATIIIMAALRTDGYNHFHKAVSELGSTDAPNKWVFNLLGYIIPGGCISIFAYNLKLRFKDSNTKSFPFYLLAMSGGFAVIAGLFPADMENRSSLATIIHSVGSAGGGFCWLLCAFTLWWQLKKDQSWRTVAIITFIIPFVMFLAMFAVPSEWPGIGQRIGFAANYFFIFILAVKQLQPDSNPKQVD